MIVTIIADNTRRPCIARPIYCFKCWALDTWNDHCRISILGSSNCFNVTINSIHYCMYVVLSYYNDVSFCAFAVHCKFALLK